MKHLTFDLVVIGGGGGGFVSAKLAHGLGKKVALIEKDKLGGECTWTGCVPSKTLIHVAHMFNSAKKLHELGIASGHEAKSDSVAVMQYIRKIRQQVYKASPPEIFEQQGIKVLFGAPHFVDNHTIMIDNTTIIAKKFIISTGSSPFVPPIEGLNNVDYLTNQNFFELEKLPESLTILGGGPIGIEIACALNTLGINVTVIEMKERILTHDDSELASMLQEKMRERGITILTEHKVNSVASSDGNIQITCQKASGKTVMITAEKLLIATGRKPNIEGLDLENAGVVFNHKGITVDRTLRTTSKNIYACGDVTGPYLFSHMAEYQAIIATRNAIFPFKKKVDYTNLIWVTFSDPELASVGLLEAAARQHYGDRVRVYKVKYNQIDRAVVDGNLFGVAKFICDHRGCLLGAQVLGARAGEIIHEVQLGRTLGVNFAQFDSVIHAYPTYADIIKKGARACRVDMLKSNFFVRLASKLFKRSKKGK